MTTKKVTLNEFRSFIKHIINEIDMGTIFPSNPSNEYGDLPPEIPQDISSMPKEEQINIYKKKLQYVEQELQNERNLKETTKEIAKEFLILLKEAENLSDLAGNILVDKMPNAKKLIENFFKLRNKINKSVSDVSKRDFLRTL